MQIHNMGNSLYVQIDDEEEALLKEGVTTLKKWYGDVLPTLPGIEKLIELIETINYEY